MQFCAAKRHKLLLTLLVRLNWDICVPGEVDAEVRGKRRSYPTLADPWRRFTSSGRVQILDRIELHRDDQAEVRDVVARLRGTGAALALTQAKDLGEYLVVGHGIALRQSGREVTVLMDDEGGRQLALSEGLPVVDMQRLLLLGHHLGVPDVDTKVKVKSVYESLLPFGGSLVAWSHCRLREEL